MTDKNIKVGILGASGYMGGEALRVLAEHPNVSIEWVSSRSEKKVANVHRNFYGKGLSFLSPGEIFTEDGKILDSKLVDVVFVALPSGNTSKLAAKLVEQGIKLIDLGADYRLNDQDTWEAVYGKEHTSWNLQSDSVYGIPELNEEKRATVKNAKIIANPGCYSSSAILGLAPLMKLRNIDKAKLVVDGLSGTAGAGAELDKAIHHPELANNVVMYNMVNHRHSYEMEQELSLIAGGEVTVSFSCGYIPISRGIVGVCHAFFDGELNREELLNHYKDFYKGEQFVVINDEPYKKGSSWQSNPYPWVATTSGTNYCFIGLDVDPIRKRVVVVSVLDSMGKGGSHAGVQNMNIMFGLPENTGLNRIGNHPY